MVHGTEERIKAVKSRIEYLRAAAAFSSKLKPVISSFDGKNYNVRFDEAIRALGDGVNNVYVVNHYGHIYIDYWFKGNDTRNDLYLMYGYGCISEDFIKEQSNKKEIFFDGKKIIAGAMIENVNTYREKLLKEAYDLETAFNNIDDIQSKLLTLKKAWENITGSIPCVLLDTYGIKRYV